MKNFKDENEKDLEIKFLKEQINHLKKENVYFKDHLELQKFYTFLDMPEGDINLSCLPNIIEFINSNKKIKIYFKFDWETYNSQIVIKGLDTQEEIMLDTPQIPLMGACFSNFVSTKMVIGQMFVSSMLEMVRFNLEYLANERYVIDDRDYDIEIIKIDRCFYAPFLVRKNKEKKEEYQPILEERYPEALEVLKNLKDGENYWKIYHDNH